MNRLVVFCFFEKDGIVDSYIDFLLKELKSISSDIIVAVNGKVNNNGKRIFRKYTKQIIVRNNIGNDGGAYAEICTKYLGEKKLLEYNEIVFCNDTFFGPFISFREIFGKMESLDVDFWGLNIFKNGFWSFIESYFLVFRKRIIESRSLYDFCIKMCKGIAEDSEYSYYAFELGIYHYLVNKKFKPGTYIDAKNASVYLEADICIQQYGLPILKKKSFSPIMYDEERQVYVLKYIKDHYQYDIKKIVDSVKRKYGIYISERQILNCSLNQCCPPKKDLYVPRAELTDREIQKFLETQDKIYIYGAGIYAKIIWYLYQDYINNFGGFIVSEQKNRKTEKFCGQIVREYSEIDPDAKIIIGLNSNNSKEVLEKIKGGKNILILWEKD